MIITELLCGRYGVLACLPHQWHSMYTETNWVDCEVLARMHYHIFLSYSRQDKLIMQRVTKDLRQAGFVVWTDEGIEAGSASWQRVIEDAILNSLCLVCIMTPNAKNSEWVREELNFARIQRKPVILLMAVGDETNAIPFGYSRSQYVDIRSRELYFQNMRRMITGLRKRFAKEELVPITGLALASNDDANDFDQAFGINIDEISKILPEPFEWCEILAGETQVDEFVSRIEPFHMAKYPITTAQFQVFVDAADGYTQDQWWDFSEEAQAWRAASRKQAANAIFPDLTLPRIEVSWYEAVAFTRWLSNRLEGGMRITLPSEQQWQWAAQGDDGRMYPWGNNFSKERANTLKTGVLQPTPVDQFRNGLSPFGVQDLCGNVYEWTLSEWDSFQIDMSGDFDRVIRGGAWDASRTAAQVTMRNYAAPDARNSDIGFRICAIYSE